MRAAGALLCAAAAVAAIAWAIVADFFAKGSARDLDVTCAQALRRPQFVTALP